MADTKYRLEIGVQQTLAAVLPRLEEQIPTWQDEIAAGEISEQLRQVATALGWITSRDSRVKPIGRQTSPSTVRPIRAKREKQDDNELLPTGAGTMSTVEG
ncbi:MAG: hypothetical protein ACOYB2_10440 [Limnohabitans sp.]